MAEIVRMPKLSDTMTEGVVAAWHKKVGDKVKSGEVLAEIETDKATMEFESFTDGVLLHIGVEKGKTAAVDSVLAVLIAVVLDPSWNAGSLGIEAVIVLFAIEAMARKQLVRFAVLVATFLVFGSVALVVTAELINDWRLVVAVVLGFAAAALLFLNVRELLRD